MNNPFRGTLETFLNGPDSSTSGTLCNLSFTNFSQHFSSCTMRGETLLGVLPESLKITPFAGTFCASDHHGRECVSRLIVNCRSSQSPPFGQPSFTLQT